MSKNKIDMEFFSDKFDDIKRSIMGNGSGKDLKNTEFVSSETVEKVKSRVKNNMYATKEDYMEILARLEGMRAELTYMTSILEDGEGYENLRSEVSTNQERHAKEISADIASLKTSLEDKIEELKKYLENKDEAKLDRLAKLEEGWESGFADLKEANEKGLLDLKEASEKGLGDIKDGLDERLDIFKDKLSEEMKSSNEEFKKELMNEFEEKQGENKRSISVVTWLLIINAAFLMALLYFTLM